MREDDNDRILDLYRRNKGVYQASSSWVATKEFLPSSILAQVEKHFVPDSLINSKRQFIADKIEKNWYGHRDSNPGLSD